MKVNKIYFNKPSDVMVVLHDPRIHPKWAEETSGKEVWVVKTEFVDYEVNVKGNVYRKIYDAEDRFSTGTIPLPGGKMATEWVSLDTLTKWEYKHLPDTRGFGAWYDEGGDGYRDR